jgi:hypothetical protein
MAFHTVLTLISEKCKSVLPKAALGSLLAGAALVGVPNAVHAYNPAYTTASPVGSYYTQTPASFGFFFDTDRDVTIDGLGFSSQPSWGSGTSYEVWLWSYVNAGNSIGDYTLIDKKTFTHGTPYEFNNGYFWQGIPLVTLNDSTTGDPTNQKGFVIGVVGDFTNLPGNVQYEGGVATFLPGIVNNDSGYNPGPNTDAFWPVPVYPDTSGVPGASATAYFNGNLSFYSVPGPLPMFGAAAGFAWSRRLRKRIQATK